MTTVMRTHWNNCCRQSNTAYYKHGSITTGSSESSCTNVKIGSSAIDDGICAGKGGAYKYIAKFGIVS